MEALALLLAALAYVWWVRRWPWQQCRWCKGKGRFTHTTLTGRKVARDCQHCASGWILRRGRRR